jgi:cytochrome c556
MTHREMRPAGIIAMVALVGSIALTGPASGQTQNAHKLTLRAIMQDLGAEYGRLTSALMIDDFKTLEESAKAIQTHPLPDELVVAIKNKLGRNFSAFEQPDEHSHRQAAALAKRAAAKDIIGAAKAFGGMTDGCVTCHKRFRAALRSLSD